MYIYKINLKLIVFIKRIFLKIKVNLEQLLISHLRTFFIVNFFNYYFFTNCRLLKLLAFWKTLFL
jgi:hypothetical protein